MVGVVSHKIIAELGVKEDSALAMEQVVTISAVTVLVLDHLNRSAWVVPMEIAVHSMVIADLDRNTATLDVNLPGDLAIQTLLDQMAEEMEELVMGRKCPQMVHAEDLQVTLGEYCFPGCDNVNIG
jgi:hypothetical protein